MHDDLARAIEALEQKKRSAKECARSAPACGKVRQISRVTAQHDSATVQDQLRTAGFDGPTCWPTIGVCHGRKFWKTDGFEKTKFQRRNVVLDDSREACLRTCDIYMSVYVYIYTWLYLW